VLKLAMQIAKLPNCQILTKDSYIKPHFPVNASSPLSHTCVTWMSQFNDPTDPMQCVTTSDQDKNMYCHTLTLRSCALSDKKEIQT